MIHCPTCGYDKTPDGSEFCDACGSELPLSSTPNIPPSPTPTIAETIISEIPSQPELITPQIPIANPLETPSQPEPITPQIPLTKPSETPTVIQTEAPFIPQMGTTTARLIPKQTNAPIPEFIIDENSLIGIFDPDSGPVEIDLENFLGNETVSRQHAEIYPEGGVWKIKDLGSTNGTFIKPLGQTRFGARITIPTPLNSGDEIAIAKIRFLFQIP
jgi:hypothetical protein